MPFLLNTWYAAGFPAEFTTKPIRRTIVGEPLAIFRDQQGRLCMVQDRCPHRFVPLSMGVVEGSQIRCSYHGLAFDGRTGACSDRPADNGTVIPSSP